MAEFRTSTKEIRPVVVEEGAFGFLWIKIKNALD